MSKHRIEHARVGVIEYEDEEVIAFAGLPGFPAARRFVVRAHARGERIAWLVCLDLPALALAVVSPWDFVPSYAPAFADAALAAVDAASLDDIEIVTVAVVDAHGLSLNLAAPILIHRARGRGVQWILESGDYPLRTLVARAATSREDERPAAARQIESNPQT